MGHYATLLLQRITTYQLDKRSRIVARHKKKLEEGKISEGMAKVWLHRIEPLVKAQERCFNPLPLAPDQDELPDWDIEVGTRPLAAWHPFPPTIPDNRDRLNTGDRYA